MRRYGTVAESEHEEEHTMSNHKDFINSESLVLTVPEAAKLLRIGIGRCYELARCGQLRSIKIGKRILIPRASIFEFLGMTEVTPA